ncbi:MAG: serine esterase [Candidatus Sericytochromatia bacterium]|nr:serine esterase [Candidatus Sericytochromatia bacterium]
MLPIQVYPHADRTMGTPAIAGPAALAYDGVMSETLPITTLKHRFIRARVPSGKLVIGLHGRGDSMAGLGWLPQTLGLDGVNYLFCNAPDRWPPGYSWYDLAPDQAPGILRSRAILVTLLDELMAQGWAAADILLFGFSQGCVMSLDVGLRYPHRLAGILGVSGFLFFPELVAAEASPHAAGMPILLTHGTEDDRLPIEATREHVQLLQAGGIPVVWREFAKGHTIDVRAEVPVLRTFLINALGLLG